ncbi:hypothetical protein PPERSA_12884 [Pseudocohnilembus persalinus]|uniref:Exocyst complex component Sec10-like alpha-helical bundle domain-containing protein n=1 Tax=Pseudocohnilembus persalinus TaxID=266149 RepID=A0A0V0Q8A9_PSEPJ|nr:hypothetical protein PPERSA_12884 [Pseudocohnilembus persalinus]|eukprot:KRW98405.1 hypothetical protein PPERSA_12884 [Pseudocohnilembus persalinus]
MSDIVPQLNRKTHLNPKFFTLIPQFNTLIQRIDLIFEDAIKSDSMSYELELLGKKKQKQMQNLEILIQNQNQNALAIIYIHANQMLNENQSKKDFLAKQVSDKLKETNAIRLFIEFVQSYTYVIEKNASPINKSRYFDAIGEQIIKILIDHYPQYKVTQSGSFQIQADISFVEKFLLKVINAKTLQRKLDQLKSLINIFKLDQESLKRYIKEECLQNIPTEIVDQYILAKKN